MKKIKYLLIMLLFVPLFKINAYELICNYSSSKGYSAVVKMECADSCKVTSCIVSDGTAATHIDDGDHKRTFANSTSTFGYCWGQMKVQNDFNTYVLTPHDCSGTLYYGCFEYTSASGMPTPTPTPTSISSDKYNDLGKCPGTSCEYIKKCGCIPAGLVDLTSRIFNLIKIIAPVLLIIIGGFDLIKAVTAADEKAIQKEQNKLIKKFVAAFIIFMLFTIVQFVAGLVSDDAKEGDLGTCFNYFVNGYNPGECETE